MVVFGINDFLATIINKHEELLERIERLFDTNVDNIGKFYWKNVRRVESPDGLANLPKGTIVTVSYVDEFDKVVANYQQFNKNIHFLRLDEAYAMWIKEKKRLIYNQNVSLLRKYELCKQTEFPSFESLPVYSEPDEDYSDFLLQINSEKPILLHDNMSVKSIDYIVANLRTTERYGCDNHLYLKYSDVSQFASLLMDEKWERIINSGKVVFVFSEVQDNDFLGDSDVLHEPSMLQVDEIQTIIRRAAWAHGAGGNFFATIFDFHPCLLTMTPMGLQKFNSLYSEILENRTVIDSLAILENPSNDDQRCVIEEAFYSLRQINIFPHAKRINKKLFVSYLQQLLKGEYADAGQWFKAIFIAYAYSFGRVFKSRIAPAILYGHEAGVTDIFIRTPALEDTLLSSVWASFKFHKVLMPVRDPISILGFMMERLSEHYKDNYQYKPYFQLPYNLYALEVRFPHGDQRLDMWRVVRFEDFKLYPRETLEKVCEFCVIPWDDSLLHLTIQGEDAGTFHNTAGFDTSPLRKKHDQFYSAFDFLRIEILGIKFAAWGYDYRYHDGTIYDRETILKMMELPFKWEMLLELDSETRENFHANLRKLVFQELNEDGIRKDKYGNTEWVKWLRPIIPENKRLYSKHQNDY